MTVQRVSAGGFGPVGVAEPEADAGSEAAATGFGALLAALVSPAPVVVPGVPGGLDGSTDGQQGEANPDAALAGLGALLTGEPATPLPPAALGLGLGEAPQTAGSVPPYGTGTLVAEALTTAASAHPEVDGLGAPPAAGPGTAGLAAAFGAGLGAALGTEGSATAPAPGAEPGTGSQSGAADAVTPTAADVVPEASDALAPVPDEAAPTPSALPAQAIPADTAAAALATLLTGPVPTPASSTPATAPALSSAGVQVSNPVVTAAAQHLATGQGTSRMTLTLQPEALGEVRVHLSVRDGAVQVRLSAVDAAAQALALDAPELRRMLEAIGATETRVVVNDSNSGQSHLDQRGTEQQPGTADREPHPDSADLPWASAVTADQQQTTPPPTPVRSSGLDLQM